MNMGVRAGIYLGGDRLTVAVAARRGGVQCFTVELEDLPGAHLKTELDARQLRLKRMRLGLARPLVTVKTLELPRADGGQFAEMVAFELERHVPFPPEDMRFDWTTLPGTAKGPVRILVVAAERRTVEGALRLLEEPRIKPAALTVACHDLPALLARRSKVRTAVWAHRAGGSIDLICLGQGRIHLSRTVPASDGEALAADVAATLSLLGWPECDAIWASGDGADELLASPALEQLAASVTAPPWSPAVEGHAACVARRRPGAGDARARGGARLPAAFAQPPARRDPPPDVLLGSARHGGNGRRHPGARGRARARSGLQGAALRHAALRRPPQARPRRQSGRAPVRREGPEEALARNRPVHREGRCATAARSCGS